MSKNVDVGIQREILGDDRITVPVDGLVRGERNAQGHQQRVEAENGKHGNNDICNDFQNNIALAALDFVIHQNNPSPSLIFLASLLHRVTRIRPITDWNRPMAVE